MRSSSFLVLDMTKKRPLAEAIKKEVLAHKTNYSIIISGRTQMRKSTIGLGIGISIYPEFDFERDFAIIKTTSMIKAVNTAGPRGCVKFLDEVGVGLDHHNWYQFMQKAMSYIVQTFGFEGKILVVTVPYEDYVNKDVLKLFNMRIEIIGKDEKRKYALAKVETLQYDQKTKKLYRKYPRGKFPDGKMRRIRLFKIHFPKKEVLEKYFAIANEEKKALQAELVVESAKIEREKMKKVFSPDYYVNQIVQHPEKFVKVYNQRKFVAPEKIMNNFPGIGTKRASQIKDMAEERLFGEGAGSTETPQDSGNSEVNPRPAD